MARVLIIDDDRMIGEMLSQKIVRMGHHATWSDTLQKGLETSYQQPYDIVLLDVGMPDGNGIDALPQIRRSPFAPEVLVMTGYANIEDAEAAIKNGAYDYIRKMDMDDHKFSKLQHILKYRQESKTRPPHSHQDLDLEGIVGQSESIQKCHQTIAKAAHTDANVLISGETGTGKELFARAIHNNSKRRGSSLVVVDCAALPETLVEALLFGSMKGAYTGADRSREGLVSQAHGGTLFLDEVGEMPLSIQKVFLRVLQERSYRPVGSQKEVPSDFRLIAATNRNLEEMVATGLFRKDLLFRLRTIQLDLPPLCKRREDIKALVNYYVTRICNRLGMRPKALSVDFTDALLLYDWPGNVRELINTLETAITMADDHQKLFARHLPDVIRLHVVRSALSQQPNTPASLSTPRASNNIDHIPSLKEYRKKAAADAEKEYLHRLLIQTSNDINAALNYSKLSRSRFYELLKEHNLQAMV